MQVQINKPKEQVAVPTSNEGKVVLSKNPIRTKVWLDKDGNEIDPKTKQIIKKNE